MRDKVKFEPIAPHHSYIGIMIMILGGLMAPHELYGNWGIIFLIGGGVILADDVIEHTICGNTPLRLFFERVIVKFLRRKEND